MSTTQVANGKNVLTDCFIFSLDTIGYSLAGYTYREIFYKVCNLRCRQSVAIGFVDHLRC